MPSPAVPKHLCLYVDFARNFFVVSPYDTSREEYSFFPSLNEAWELFHTFS